MIERKVAPRSKPLGIRELGPGHTIEYFFRDHLMWVRETRNGRILEQRLDDALRQDPWERLCFFAGLQP